MAAKTAQLQGLIDASQFERILAILKKRICLCEPQRT